MTEDQAPAPRDWKPLGPEQRRVLGVLIEKAKTTPATYPMTVNALVAGSNQKNNREPPMSLTSDDVERVLEELRVLGAVTEAHESTRTPKFRHRAYEWLRVSRAELAVLTELLLRGSQTLGELRSRAARMEPIADMAALEPLVEALVRRGLVIELTAPGRGQIVDHNLYKDPELAVLRAQVAGRATRAAWPDDGEPTPPSAAARSAHEAAAPGAPDDRCVRLEAAVLDLRDEVSRLAAEVRDLETRLAERSG